MEFIMFIGTQLLYMGPSSCSHLSFAKKTLSLHTREKKACSLKRWFKQKAVLVL